MAFWGKKNKEIESREDRKKSGIKRLWQKVRNIDWHNPVNRWKLLFASLVVCVIVFGGGYGVLSFTNSPSFCSSCHEMAPEYTTYTASSHNEISCVQCHIKPGFINMITHKMKSVKEVYYHVTGAPNQIVQTEEEEISNQNCLQCHSKNRLVTASGDLKVNHKGHIEKGIPCVTCHSGVVHAKIAARDLNTAADRSDWNSKNAQKLIEEKYLRPNMGTCIDCHDKVNKGEKPWKDPAYSVPPNPEETAKESSSSEKAATAGTSTEQNATAGTAQQQNTEAVKAENDKKTQDIILQAVSNEQTNVKISMSCTTCHREIKVPSSHKSADWSHGHGSNAIASLDTCMNCHQDSKWAKQIPKEDIMTLLTMGNQQTKKYTPDIALVQKEARTNKFCSACHSKRPPGHMDSNSWLTAHAQHAKTSDQKQQCYVCHDKSKPISGATTAKAPTDVYCEYCHRTGVPGEPKS